jgi:hypothetical protein
VSLITVLDDTEKGERLSTTEKRTPSFQPKALYRARAIRIGPFTSYRCFIFPNFIGDIVTLPWAPLLSKQNPWKIFVARFDATLMTFELINFI